MVPRKNVENMNYELTQCFQKRPMFETPLYDASAKLWASIDINI